MLCLLTLSYMAQPNLLFLASFQLVRVIGTKQGFYYVVLLKQWKKQESPPAWTQEAHRPSRSKYTLCWYGWGVPLLGVPLPRWGNPPSQHGVPQLPRKGLPPCKLDGLPPVSWIRYSPSAGWGTPHPGLGRGVPTLPPRQLDGVPPIHTWEWGTPHQLDGVPVPQLSDLGRGTPPPVS